MTSDQFAALQRKVEQLKQDKAKSVGAKEELTRRLRKDFGLKTLAEVRARIKELEAKDKKLAALIAKKEQELARDFPGLVDDEG